MDRDNSSGEATRLGQRASANRTGWGSSSLEAVAAMLPPSADIYILCVLAIVGLFSKKTFSGSWMVNPNWKSAPCHHDGDCRCVMIKKRHEMHVKKTARHGQKCIENISRQQTKRQLGQLADTPPHQVGLNQGFLARAAGGVWEKFGEMVPPSPRQNQTHAHGSHTTTTRAKIKLDFYQNRPAPNDDDHFSRSTPVIPPTSQHVQAHEEGRHFRQGM